jgi:tetratricopeptide (TPR) repeat protein
MSDPLRTGLTNDHKPSSIDGDAERDAKIESLLLSGLDHYFASHYAQAIDVWTRALFLDRQHARARAYIERARSALAEQQRESDELLHNGVAAFERGEIEAARQLLNAAVERGGAHEVALAFLTRIDRLSAAAPAPAVPAAPPTRRSLRPAAAPLLQANPPWVVAIVLIAVTAVAVLGLSSWDRIRTFLPVPPAADQVDPTPMRVPADPIVVPRSAETAIERAQALYASGRVYDALRAIDLVRDTDPLRSDADKLKALIQRELLAHQASPPGAEAAQP